MSCFSILLAYTLSKRKRLCVIVPSFQCNLVHSFCLSSSFSWWRLVIIAILTLGSAALWKLLQINPNHTLRLWRQDLFIFHCVFFPEFPLNTLLYYNVLCSPTYIISQKYNFLRLIICMFFLCPFFSVLRCVSVCLSTKLSKLLSVVSINCLLLLRNTFLIIFVPLNPLI